jgi:hypothetical protein
MGSATTRLLSNFNDLRPLAMSLPNGGQLTAPSRWRTYEQIYEWVA